MSKICNLCQGDLKINKCSCRICNNNNIIIDKPGDEHPIQYCTCHLELYSERVHDAYEDDNEIIKLISECNSFMKSWIGLLKHGINCKRFREGRWISIEKIKKDRIGFRDNEKQ